MLVQGYVLQQIAPVLNQLHLHEIVPLRILLILHLDDKLPFLEPVADVLRFLLEYQLAANLVIHIIVVLDFLPAKIDKKRGIGKTAGTNYPPASHNEGKPEDTQNHRATSQHLRHRLHQLLAPQVPGNDFTLRIKQESRGNPRHTVLCRHRTLPPFQ